MQHCTLSCAPLDSDSDEIVNAVGCITDIAMLESSSSMVKLPGSAQHVTQLPALLESTRTSEGTSGRQISISWLRQWRECLC